MNSLPAQGDARVAAIVSAIFVTFHAIMFLWIVPTDAWKSGGDLDTYLNPAMALFRHGAFVDVDDPGAASIYRLPLYTVLTAGALVVTGGESPRPVLLANLMMLLATGLLMWRVARTWASRHSTLVLVLVLFNPLAIGTAYIIQPLNLNAMLYAFAGWLLLRHRRPPSAIEILCLGVVVGLSALTRPAGSILIAALPIGVSVLAWLTDQRTRLIRTFLVSCMASVIGFIAIMPWMLYGHASGHGFRLSSVKHNTLFLRDNNSSLEFYSRGGSLQEAKLRVLDDIEKWQLSAGEAFSAQTPYRQAELVNDYLLRRLTEFSAGTALKAWGIALVNMFVGGGATNLRMAFDIEAPKAWDLITRQSGYNFITAFFAAVSESPPLSIVISVLSVGYVLICRVFGLIGIVVAAKRGDWAPLILAMGLCTFFAVIHGFVAESIYRLPIEPFLILLAAYGLDGASRKFRRQE